MTTKRIKHIIKVLIDIDCFGKDIIVKNIDIGIIIIERERFITVEGPTFVEGFIFCSKTRFFDLTRKGISSGIPFFVERN